MIEALYAGPPFLTAVPNWLNSTCRLWRVSDWRPWRIWSSWTGSVPCDIGNVWPSPTVGADGLPGLTSRKKFPSRKVLGRIAKVAS